jgi:predicted peptidase
MTGSEISVVESAGFRCLLSVPAARPSGVGTWPILCFLHGYREAAPLEIRTALALHSPLRRGSFPGATRDFIVVAPQLAAPGGDVWRAHADAVRRVAQEVQRNHGGDPERTFLTGFSYGGNGVLDLAADQADVWAALWPVDPTRVPERDSGRPIWLSFGDHSRGLRKAFLARLDLPQAANTEERGRVHDDRGLGHAPTADAAYAAGEVYAWLLTKRRSLPR